MLKVEHTNYGTLFAAMIDGAGSLVSENDEEGDLLPFLTTDEILKQIAKFGFYVQFNELTNLPGPTLDYLTDLNALGYDKINRILVETIHHGQKSWQPAVVVFKSESNTDLLTYGCKVGKTTFHDKMFANTLMNITRTEGMNWDWIETCYNITDILYENSDPADSFRTDSGTAGGANTPYTDWYTPEFSPYEEPEVVEDEP